MTNLGLPIGKVHFAATDKMQKIIKFDENPIRLDLFITKNIHDISREFAKKLICCGKITVNGLLQKPSYRLSAGDRIKIDIPEIADKSATTNVGQKDFLKNILLYEDKDILVVSKPNGICVHPNDSNWEKFPDGLEIDRTSLVSIIYRNKPEIFLSGALRMGLVHRLDKDTSGVMVIAKNPDSQEKLLKQFREKTVHKVYVGVVSGKFQEKNNRIDLPIGRPTGSSKIKVWRYGRPSITEFVVISQTQKYSILEIHPITGRTNQIRVHFSHINHPVVGDRLYGGEPASRLMLHSKKLSFIHPTRGRKVCFESPLPDDFIQEWNRLKKG